MPSVKNIYADQPYEYEVDLTRHRLTDGEEIPATDILDCELFVAAAAGEEAIDPDLVKPMAERSAIPGRYFGVIPTSAINDHLKGVYNRKKVRIVARSMSLDTDGVRIESEVTFLDVRSI